MAREFATYRAEEMLLIYCQQSWRPSGTKAGAYPDALPVLINHLERGGYPDRVMEGLGRALAVMPTIAYWSRLKARYLSPRAPGEEVGTAVALAACATGEQLEDLVSFVESEERGESRIYFLSAIQRVGGSGGLRIFEELRSDPILGREASALLAKQP